MVEWNKIINETVGMYLINNAMNYEQLNRGILFFDYIPYIDLGKERIEVCQQFFSRHQDRLKSYQLFDDVVADIQPIIDERNNRLQSINEVSTSKEMLVILKNIFHDKALEINELKSKYVWLRKEQRPYRNLTQIVQDIETTDEEKILSILKNNNFLEIHVEDDKYSFFVPINGSGEIINLLD